VTWADYAIVFICIVSGAFGFWRGFAKEALALVSWLAAIWLAWRFAWIVEPLLGEWSAAPELRIWAARAIVFVVVLAIGGLIAWLVRALVRGTGLSSTDRALGGLFGVARGLLIVGLGAIALQLSGLEQNPWWRDALLRPFSEQIAEGIRHYAELGGRMLEEQPSASFSTMQPVG
jgi:membrane protein required for colicin V production